MKRKYIYTILIIIAAVLFLPRHSILAAGDCDQVVSLGGGQGIFAIIMDVIIRVASWIWVIIADLAGKLMSNEWVYASGIGLDKTLWKLRNYMKNIANFTIAGLFIYQIAKGVIGKNAFDIKALLPKILISSILVNMSWFIMGAAIDLANLGTAAIGAVPQAFFTENKPDQANLQKLRAYGPEKISIQMECKTPITQDFGDPKTRDYSLDKVWARFNDMSGPLVYMGMSIFRFQEYNLTNDNVNSRTDLTIASGLKILILLMFLAPIVALFVVNLKRVAYLWLVIIFSPLLIVFDEKLGMSKMPNIEGKVGGNSIKELLSIKEVFGMIFAPVFTIGAMAITLILSSSMFFVLGGSPGQEWGEKTRISTVLGGGTSITRESKETSSFTAPGTDITFQGDIFKDVSNYAGGIVGYLILVCFTIVLLRGVLGVSVSSSKLAKGTYDGIMNLGKNLAMGFNFIPIGGGKPVSIGGLMNTPERLMNETSSKINARMGDESKQLSDAFLRNTGIAKMMGINLEEMTDLESFQMKSLQSSLKGTTNLKKYLASLKSKLSENKGKVNINMTTGTNFKKMLTEYATANPTSIKEIPALYKEEIKDLAINTDALTNFTPEQANQLFDTSTDLGKAFTAFVASQLTGDSSIKTTNVSNTTTLFSKVSDDAKVEGASETPSTTPPEK